LIKDLSIQYLSALILIKRIRSFIKFSKIRIPLAYRELYPIIKKKTLYLNRFRGKPAISEFDWPFTPNHKSSQSFSTDTSSVLQLILL